MKKLTLAITLMLGMTSFTQENYASYSEGKINVVTKPGKSQGDIYMYVSSKSGIILDKSEKIKFLEFVKECHVKASEWDSIAKANNILDMSSKYYGKLAVNGYFSYGGWHFGKTTMKSIFAVREGVVSSYLYMNKMTASDNQFMESETVMFSLTDKLLDELQTLLSDEAIDEFITSKNKTESLFE